MPVRSKCWQPSASIVPAMSTAWGLRCGNCSPCALFDANEQTPTPTLMEKILHEDPVPMRRYNPHVSRDLDAIVANCLEKKPERRYPTARELAVDLGRLSPGRCRSAYAT